MILKLYLLINGFIYSEMIKDTWNDNQEKEKEVEAWWNF